MGVDTNVMQTMNVTVQRIDLNLKYPLNVGVNEMMTYSDHLTLLENIQVNIALIKIYHGGFLRHKPLDTWTKMQIKRIIVFKIRFLIDRLETTIDEKITAEEIMLE